MQAWQQLYDPAGNLWLSSLIALLPIAFFFVALAVLRMKGWLAGTITVVIALAVALLDARERQQEQQRLVRCVAAVVLGAANAFDCTENLFRVHHDPSVIPVARFDGYDPPDTAARIAGILQRARDEVYVDVGDGLPRRWPVIDADVEAVRMDLVPQLLLRAQQE